MVDKTMKVFEGLTTETIKGQPRLLEMLALNAEQVSYYLEETILDNPFIDFRQGQELGQNKLLSSYSKDELEDLEGVKADQNLEDYLFEQIMLFRKTPIRDVMVDLVLYLDERGFIPRTPKELAQDLDRDWVLVLDALTLFKSLEPAGIGAYNLQEALMLQTERDDSAPTMAYYLLESFFEALEDRDYTSIEAQTPFSQDDILTCVNYYHMLTAYPASLFKEDKGMPLRPDFTLEILEGDQVSLRYNRGIYPSLIFNQEYYEEMLSHSDPKVQSYIQARREDYLELAESLRLREEVLMTLVQTLVGQQVSFFTKGGDKASLSIKELSALTRLSEPLLYQALYNKGLDFDGHYYRLSDFISVAAIPGRDQRTFASIKLRMAEIIQAASKDLSDQDVVTALEAEDIYISPAIVANYRKSLG